MKSFGVTSMRKQTYSPNSEDEINIIQGVGVINQESSS